MFESRIVNFFWPPLKNGDHLDLARKRCLIVICLVGGVAGLVSGMRGFQESYEVYPAQALIALLSPLIFFLAPFLVVIYKRTRVIAVFFLAVMYFAMVSVPMMAGGMFSHANLFLLPWAVMATLFLGWKEGIATALLVFVTYLTLHLFRHEISPSLIEISPETISGWLIVGLSISLFVLVGGAAVFEREMGIATNRLAAAQQEAEAANQAKTDFLANMSHEIRTPMNGIVCMAELLESSELDLQQQSYVQTIATSSDSLLAIINDILDLSKIESRHVSVEDEPFTIDSIVVYINELFAERMSQKGLEFKISNDSKIDGPVRGDALKIRQILTNLINNAFKFTEAGYVHFQIAPGKITEESVQLNFSVFDSGIGIPESRLKSVFEKFAQADSATTKRFGGTGLGLTISRQLAAAMSGNLVADSTLGAGSRFTLSLELPLAGEHDLQVDEVHEDIFEIAEDEALELSRVLVAEDNDINRMVLANLVDLNVYSLDFAVNGKEAVELFKAKEFDVILMDISMPQMDGFEATSAIRILESRLNRERTPIICLTAHALSDQKERCLTAGMDEFLTKPVRKHLLNAALAKWTTSARNSSAVRI